MFAVAIAPRVKGVGCVRLEGKKNNKPQPNQTPNQTNLKNFNQQLPDGHLPPSRDGWVFLKHRFVVKKKKKKLKYQLYPGSAPLPRRRPVRGCSAGAAGGGPTTRGGVGQGGRPPLSLPAERGRGEAAAAGPPPAVEAGGLLRSPPRLSAPLRASGLPQDGRRRGIDVSIPDAV